MHLEKSWIKFKGGFIKEIRSTIEIHSRGCRRVDNRWIRRSCARFNRRSPLDFVHLGVLECKGGRNLEDMGSQRESGASITKDMIKWIKVVCRTNNLGGGRC